MSTSPASTVHSSDVQGYSCLICRQRKVKCDRRAPCTNCVKTEKECSFVPPVRGKRKRTKPQKEGLHAKVKRYEELLQSLEQKGDLMLNLTAATTDTETSSLADRNSARNSETQDDGHRFQSRSQSQPNRSNDGEIRLVTKEESTRYVDSPVWSLCGLAADFHTPEIEGLNKLRDQTCSESNLLLSSGSVGKAEDLIRIMPPPEVLRQLQVLYVERVEPVIKILHLPTFWPLWLSAVQNLSASSLSWQAMVPALIFATVTTMEEDECFSLFNTPRTLVRQTYRQAAYQSLVRADFISTSNIMVLQAYALYLMGVRNNEHHDAAFIMSGVAIRLARKMGLHRDGTALGLSPFETEMRRRLWYHLIHIDYKMADLLGTRPSMDLTDGDAKTPLNLEDEDLDPNMKEFPPERKGITSIAICLLRCDILGAIRKFSPPGFRSDARWEALFTPDLTDAKKDDIIRQAQDYLETKYLRYCDPMEPLHIFLSIMIRSSICKMKLFAHSPRRHADMASKSSTQERNIVFANASKLLEYATILQQDRRLLRRYMWGMGTTYLWTTMLNLLIEMRHRKTGAEVSKAWQLIDSVISEYQEVFARDTGTVYVAFRKWMLEVWDECVSASKVEGLPEPMTPKCVTAIRIIGQPGTYHTADSGVQSGQPIVAIQTAMDTTLADFDMIQSIDFPDLLSFENDPNGWIQWDQLLAEGSNFGKPYGT